MPSDAESTEPDFEDVVAALLKVDPEGITGQTAGKGKPKDDDEPQPDAG